MTNSKSCDANARTDAFPIRGGGGNQESTFLGKTAVNLNDKKLFKDFSPSLVCVRAN